MPNGRLKSQEKNIFQLGLPKELSREELGTRNEGQRVTHLKGTCQEKKAFRE